MAMTIHPDCLAAFGPVFQLTKNLNEVYSYVEKGHNVVIPSTVRDFTDTLITESLAFGRIEPNNVDQINESLRTVESILEDAERLLLNDISYVTLLGVVEQVHLKWCRIFPFCR